jgi:hypothetical protein
VPEFSWRDAKGQVSEYVTNSATLAMSVIDSNGSLVDNVNNSYKRLSTNGIFTSNELIIGGRLLIDVGLVVEESNFLHLSSLAKSLREGEEDHLKQVIFASAQRLLENESKFLAKNLDSVFSPTSNIPKSQTINHAVLEKIGAVGEEIVLQTFRSIFLNKDRPDLARLVKRVSLISDEFGYDIEVITPSGSSLKIEVKSSVEMPKDKVEFFITRHESIVSCNSQNWYLIFCFVSDVERSAGEVIGWIDNSTLVKAWPVDSAFSGWKLTEIFQEKSLFNGDLAKLIWSQQIEDIT